MSTSPFDNFISRLSKVRRTSNGVSAACPAHADKTNSLSVSQASDGRVLIKCFAGCSAEQIVKKVGLTMADLFPRGRRGGRSRSATRNTATPPATGLTLAQYAEAKKLPVKFLKSLGLQEFSLNGVPAVKIPYRDSKGEEVATRHRFGLNGDDRFRWKNGTKPRLYGLNRLVPGKSIALVEGESDCHTLWFNRFRAIGVPGASTWREEWAQELDAVPKIWVVIEPDQGGQAILKWLENSKIRNKVRLIRLEGAKDVSELYLSDPGGFRESFTKAYTTARSWTEEMQALNQQRRKGALDKCRALASEPDILARFGEAIQNQGLIGEIRVAKIVYLAVTSRLLEKLASVAIKGPSSAGKSFLMEKVLAFFPASAYYALTTMSEKTLVYTAEPLRNRHLVLYEAAGLSDGFMAYATRSLLSENRLRYEVTEKTKDGTYRTRLIEKEGPTGLLLTTTAPHLNPENETRILSVTVKDTPKQTQAVLLVTAQKFQRGGRTTQDLDQWVALQEWLALGEVRVTIPYAKALARLIKPVATRLRRDFPMLLTLVCAHAILHQQTRKRDEEGQIIATLDDYRAVQTLTADFFATGVEATVRKSVRETVERLRKCFSEYPSRREEGVSVKLIAGLLGIDKSSASRRVREGLEDGYLRNLADSRRGGAYKIVLGDSLPKDTELLPAPERLREELSKKDDE